MAPSMARSTVSSSINGRNQEKNAYFHMRRHPFPFEEGDEQVHVLGAFDLTKITNYLYDAKKRQER